ncbi:MAG: hypothetical protein KBG48_01605 [Kofleriaceae bacterium]|nr:hypothetical protein [Kofleriaceae bacterium]MBP9166042.1 hypothetical protein [Kofleriaceae bacterium]MBP9857279.1 hypothetical protein [Kofleriaceae bacterium]
MDALARAEALARAAILAEVPAPALVALAARATLRRLAAEATLTTRRDGSDVIAVVAEGAVTVDGSPIGPGALIGALGGFGGAPVTARAVGAAVVLELAVDDFLDVLAEHPGATTALARRLAARLREAP